MRGGEGDGVATAGPSGPGPGLAELPRRVLETWRTRGAPGVALAALDATGVYRRALWLALELDAMPPAPSPGVAVDIGPLAADGWRQVAAARPGLAPGEARRRLEAGHRCFVARREGGVVSCLWAAGDAVRVPHLWGSPVPLDDGEVLTYDAYTVPSLRGRRLLPAVRGRMLETLRDEGVRRAVLLVAPHNEPMLRSARRSGYRLRATVVRLGLGRLGWTRTIERRRGDAPRAGSGTGSRATGAGGRATGTDV